MTEDASQQRIIPERMSAVFLVSEELLMDLGAIPDTRERRPITIRTRLRWRTSEMRHRIGVWIYERLSGDCFPEEYL